MQAISLQSPPQACYLASLSFLMPRPYVFCACDAFPDEYRTDALQAVLASLNLVSQGKPTDALNLLGEAVYLPRWSSNAAASAKGAGEVYLFENGSLVAWNLEQEEVDELVRTICQNGTVEVGPYGKASEQEEMKYQLTDNVTSISGDVVSLNTGLTQPDQAENEEVSELHFSPLPPLGKLADLRPAVLPASTESGLPMTEEAILTRLAVSSALVRSTRLSVQEAQLESFLEE